MTTAADLRMGVVLRQAVRNRCPRHLGLRPDVHLWFRDARIIDDTQWNAPKLRQTCWLVPKGRTARTAKDPEAFARVVFADAAARLADYKVGRLDQAPRRMSRAGEFSTIRAMAIPGALHRSCDLVRNASAEAARLHGSWCSTDKNDLILRAQVRAPAACSSVIKYTTSMARRSTTSMMPRRSPATDV
jgi:hypothetical protein